MKVVLDLDGVLVDFVRGVCSHHNRPYPKDEEWDGLSDRYAISELCGMSQSEFWNPLDRKFWEFLPWMHDGRQILTLLETIFGSRNIVICTSPSLNPEAAAGKMAWIQREIPRYGRQFFIGSAKEFLAGPRTLMIDDYDKNVATFSSAGGLATLVPRMWNSAYSRSTDFLGLFEAECFVLNQLDQIANE